MLEREQVARLWLVRALAGDAGNVRTYTLSVDGRLVRRRSVRARAPRLWLPCRAAFSGAEVTDVRLCVANAF